MENLHFIPDVMEIILIKSCLLFVRFTDTACTAISDSTCSAICNIACGANCNTACGANCDTSRDANCNITPSATIHETLSSVCKLWKGTIRNTRFCKILKLFRPLANFKALLKQHHEFLEEHIECQYGLLIHLHNYGILSDTKFLTLQNYSMYYEQNEILLNTLQQFTNPWTDVILWSGLNNTCQNHITHYINDTCTDKCENRPLMEDEKIAWNSLQEFLVNNFHIHEEFLQDLITSGCILKQHKKFINTSVNRFERMRILLEIIRRRSLTQVKKFIELSKKYCPRLNVIMINDETEFVKKITEIVERRKKRKELNESVPAVLKHLNNDAFAALLENIKSMKRDSKN